MQRSPGNELQPGRLLPTSQVLGASNCQQSKTTELERRNWENKCRTIAHSNRETELVLAGKRKAVLRLGRGEAQEAVTANLDRLHVVLTSTARLPAAGREPRELHAGNCSDHRVILQQLLSTREKLQRRVSHRTAHLRAEKARTSRHLQCICRGLARILSSQQFHQE